MLLSFLLYALSLFLAAAFIALAWDYTKGISPFGKSMNDSIPDLLMNDINQNLSPQLQFRLISQVAFFCLKRDGK